MKITIVELAVVGWEKLLKILGADALPFVGMFKLISKFRTHFLKTLVVNFPL